MPFKHNKSRRHKKLSEKQGNRGIVELIPAETDLPLSILLLGDFNRGRHAE
jgi:hypothetical protein